MSEENVLSFCPPGLNDTDEAQPRLPTRGERLVNQLPVDGDPINLRLAKHRLAKVIDELADMPINVVAGSKGAMLDIDHRLVIEQAIAQVMLASAMVERAMLWRRA